MLGLQQVPASRRQAGQTASSSSHEPLSPGLLETRSKVHLHKALPRSSLLRHLRQAEPGQNLENWFSGLAAGSIQKAGAQVQTPAKGLHPRLRVRVCSQTSPKLIPKLSPGKALTAQPRWSRASIPAQSTTVCQDLNLLHSLLLSLILLTEQTLAQLARPSCRGPTEENRQAGSPGNRNGSKPISMRTGKGSSRAQRGSSKA